MKFIFVIASVFLLPLTAHCQAALENMIFTVGTSTSSGGTPWSYVCWQAQNPESIKGKTFAIYRKVGDANSPALYQRQGLVSLQSNPAVIEPLLERGHHLKDNWNKLEIALTNFFKGLLPANDTSTAAEKLSVVIRGSLNDPGNFKNLVFLGRTFPGSISASVLPTPSRCQLPVYSLTKCGSSIWPMKKTSPLLVVSLSTRPIVRPCQRPARQCRFQISQRTAPPEM